MKEPWELHWKDYYFLLGLRSDAEPEAVEGAAKQLLVKYHPDKSGTGDAERFKLTNEAREVLTDSVKRRRYDAEHKRRLKQKQPHRSSTSSEVNKPDDKSNAPNDAEYKRRASKQKQSHKSPPPSEANKPDDKSNAPGFWKGVLIGGGGLLVLVAWWLSGGRNSDVPSTLWERPAERAATDDSLSNYPSSDAAVVATQRRSSQAAMAKEARHQKRSAPAVQRAEDRRREEAAAWRARKRHKAEQRRLEQSWTVRR